MSLGHLKFMDTMAKVGEGCALGTYSNTDVPLTLD